MTRPRIALVDPQECRIVLEFSGNPPRYFTMPLRANVMTEAAARTVAQQQLDALEDDQIAVFAAAATPDKEAEAASTLVSAHAIVANIRRVTRVHHHPPIALHCPCCTGKLTTADSPSLEYFDHCGGCGRQVVITRDEGGAIVISVQLDEEP
jgi:hypothetical protein